MDYKNKFIKAKNAIIVLKTIFQKKYNEIISTFNSGEKGKNRVLIMFFGVLFICNYLMFCLLTDKNIFNIFPSIPILDNRIESHIYLPATNGNSIIQEKRLIPEFGSDETLARFLFDSVVKGSKFENTRVVVPINIDLKKVWIIDISNNDERVCIFDIEPGVLRTHAKIIEGSEAIFKEALKKTIVANIKNVSQIEVVEDGASNEKLWEM